GRAYLGDQLVGLTDEDARADGLGRHEAPLLGHQEGAMSVVDLEIALLGGRRHRGDVVAVLLPDLLEAARHVRLVPRELADLVGEVEGCRDLRSALLDDPLGVHPLAWAKHHGARARGRGKRRRWQAAGSGRRLSHRREMPLQDPGPLVRDRDQAVAVLADGFERQWTVGGDVDRDRVFEVDEPEVEVEETDGTR